MRPEPPEDEIQWILNEASKYLSDDLQVRRSDVLSAWHGIRPLAVDPHATSTASASRDHTISVNPKNGVLFVAGGKWTTYREMAEDAIDRIIEVNIQCWWCMPVVIPPNRTAPHLPSTRRRT